jgi:antibiotic biosynthesis monooxygenase (ABM) superfamily enzyme
MVPYSSEVRVMEQAAMTGSAKQIEWAQQIRADKAAELEAWRQDMLAVAAKSPKYTPEQVTAAVAGYEALVAKVLSNAAATYWIDRRSFSARQLLKDVRNA